MQGCKQKDYKSGYRQIFFHVCIFCADVGSQNLLFWTLLLAQVSHEFENTKQTELSQGLLTAQYKPEQLS